MFGTLQAIQVVEPPKDLVQRFKNVDERLDLKFVQFPFSDGANMNSVRHWAITLQWTESDKRRALVQRGELPESHDFDVLAFLPLNCNVHDSFSYFERAAKGLLKDGGDVEKMVSRLHRFNDGVRKEAIAPIFDQAQEMIEDNIGTLFAAQGKDIPKVVLSGKPLPADMTK